MPADERVQFELKPRRWWVIGSAVVLGVVGAACHAESSDGECHAVREFIAYNEDFNRQTWSITGLEPEPAPVDYQGWASRLQLLADDIEDPDLASHASSAADLADQFVALVTRSSTELTPEELEDLSVLHQRFGSEISTLHEACPDMAS